MNLTKSRTAKFVAGLAGFAIALSFVVTPVTTSAATVAELQAMIASLSAQLAALSGTTTTTVAAYTFNTNLTVGSKGADVMALQKLLNTSADTQVAATGAGSPGNETSTFGPATKAAVIKFQIKNGITPAAGYVGAITRAKLNSMGTAVVPGTPTTPGLPTGGSMVVTAGTQPANSLAPQKAARVPFTTFSVTAGSADVTINSVTVQRVGFADNAVFAGVVLLKGDGTQVGVAKTLNSDNQAFVGEPYVVKAGTTEMFTVAGNMAADNSLKAGQVAALNVIAINTTATVTGSLPISGAQHTINASLAIGTSIPTRGSFDPNATANKEIGTTNYTFSSIKVDAGSEEKLRLLSIRWNQSGSASKEDLANVKVYVDGTAYPTTVSADGKYYSASFDGGLLIDKGFSKEVSIKGDIVGGTGRNIAFDLYKPTDLYLKGETFGYGITPASTGTGFSTTAPWYNAAGVVTITAGSATTISASNTVGAQNIAVLSNDQPLGGWEVKIRGEAVTVSEMIFNLTAVGDQVNHITNIKLVDANGAVIAGPEDGVGAAQNGTVTFTNSVKFPVGTTIIRMVGKLGSTFASGDTVQASTTPSTWGTPTGETTGDTVSLASFSTPVQGNKMTVRAGALAISASTQPTARQIVAGAQGFEFARYVLDAGQSGEDVKLVNFKAYLTMNTVTGSDLSNCALYDGTTNLTSDTNVTLGATTGSNTFTFNNGGFVVPKGTTKTLSMKCDLASSATGNLKWGLASADYGSAYTAATGVTSGLTIAETVTENLGQVMTAATAGSYTVTADSSLLYKMAQAGTSVELAKFRFTAGSTEDVDLKQIALVLGNTASSSPADLVGERVTLWNGSTQIGTAQFGGANPDHATSTILSPAPRITRGESVVITVKADLAAQNQDEGTPGAFIAVYYNGDNNDGLNGNYATGVSSQTTVSGGTTGSVTTNGVRIFRTIPTVAVISNGGTLSAGGDLYKFTVTNPNSRDVVFKKFTFSIATTSGAVKDFTLYGDGVAFNGSVANQTGSDGSSATLVLNAAVGSQAKIVPANSTKTYILRATTAVDTASQTETINLALLADTSFPSLKYLMGTVGELSTSNIIWSPFSTTTPVADSATESNLDWTNGYGMPAFPSNASFPVQVWTRSN